MTMGDHPVTDPLLNPWETQRSAMGAFIRHQREMHKMTLRQLSQATQVSNAYLSQIERGMHDPTLRVLIQIGEALQVSVDDMIRYSRAAEVETEDTGRKRSRTEIELQCDPYLTAAEKEALLAVYRSYVSARRDW